MYSKATGPRATADPCTAHTALFLWPEDAFFHTGAHQLQLSTPPAPPLASR